LIQRIDEREEMLKIRNILIGVILISIFVYSFGGMERQIDRETIIKLQQALKDAGYDVGSVDGIMGQKTIEALKSYLIDRGMEPTAEFTEETLNLLFAPEEKEPDSAEAESPAGGLNSRHTTIGAAFFVFILAILFIRKFKKTDLKKALERADKTFQKGRLDRAQKKYEKILKALR
jgi:hypothetical protein